MAPAAAHEAALRAGKPEKSAPNHGDWPARHRFSFSCSLPAKSSAKETRGGRHPHGQPRREMPGVDPRAGADHWRGPRGANIPSSRPVLREKFRPRGLSRAAGNRHSSPFSGTPLRVRSTGRTAVPLRSCTARRDRTQMRRLRQESLVRAWHGATRGGFRQRPECGRPPHSHSPKTDAFHRSPHPATGAMGSRPRGRSPFVPACRVSSRHGGGAQRLSPSCGARNPAWRRRAPESTAP